MSAWEDRGAIQAVTSSLLSFVESTDGQPKSAAAIEIAALMLETAAYNMAGKAGASEVSKLIVYAAELERLADGFRESEAKSADNVVSIFR
ncbi:hypothetical protein [Pseudaestuariivita rosea]|uniref:hypothetical protein n=1 Tax=Pseudaestuariivita rosea TaxID=2763263 RepID=UPI001ABBB225|nr:hypothetical protein [Pseudaestuariivita rosea]